MNDATERDLMRWLHGELAPERAAELERRLELEPELARRYRSMRQSWQQLELPPPSPVPPGFRDRVVARAREASEARAPLWARAAATAALVAGVTVGVSLPGFEPEPAERATELTWTLESEPGLAELYLEGIEAGSWESNGENGS